jgi:hypothetical protein
MSRMLFALLLGMVVVHCASLRVRTEGVSGPIAWRATDLKIQAAGEATGVIGAGVQQEVYSFTLVLRETHGTALTFTKMAYRIDSGPGIRPFFAEQGVQWSLRPRGELRWPLHSTWSCTGGDCVRPGLFAPVWHIVLTGTDTQGQPVRVVIDLTLPANPAALEKR